MASGYGQHPFHAPFNPLQDNHLNDLLTHAEARGSEFILCVSIGDCSDTDALWRDTGLDDGFGSGRPAYTRWVGALGVVFQQVLAFGYIRPLGVVFCRPQSAAAYEQQEPTTHYGAYGNCWRDSGDSGRYR